MKEIFFPSALAFAIGAHLALVGSAAAGTATIDSFTSAPVGIYPVVASAQDPVAYFGYEYASDILSGVRFVQLNRGINTTPGTQGDVRLALGDTTASGSSLELSGPSGYAANLLLFYGYVPPGPDVPAFNFSDSDGFVLRFDRFESTLNQAMTIRAEVYDNFGETWSVTTSFGPSVDGGEAFISFASFNLVDFSNIDDLVFTFDLPHGSEIALDSIGTRLVPAPGTGLVAILGGVLFLRRR